MGTIIRNGIEYGGGISPDIEDKINNAKGIELTQAEYNALSEEEQKTGLYWITDVDNEINSADALTSDDIVNNLESTATDLPLSANMGRELDEKIIKCEGVVWTGSTTAGTGIKICTLSEVLPQNAVYCGTLIRKWGGATNMEYSNNVGLNPNGTAVMAMPTITQSSVSIDFSIFYKERK